MFLLLPFAKTYAQDTENKNSGSVYSIIQTLYNVISGPAGRDRDWEVFRSLFADEARMYIAVQSKDSGTVLRTLTPEQYIEKNKIICL